jgi:hypothetical protein
MAPWQLSPSSLLFPWLSTRATWSLSDVTSGSSASEMCTGNRGHQRQGPILGTIVNCDASVVKIFVHGYKISYLGTKLAE